jgi:energy-coupling factor transport system permease protein
MLAALSVLLVTSSRAQIMSGIYQLSLPFRAFGIQPERFAARLWLTLHYVEHMPPGTLKTLREHHWDIDALQIRNAAPDRIALEFPRWRWLDILLILMLPVLWWSTQ